MTGVPPFRSSEQLIGALIPAALQRPRPTPLPAIELHDAEPPTAAQDVVELSAGRIDRSGRIPAAAAVAALGWAPGAALRLEVRHRRIVLRPAASGSPARGSVTARAQIVVPAAARTLAGITAGSTVVLAACEARQVLVVHAAVDVVRLLRCIHAQILGRPA